MYLNPYEVNQFLFYYCFNYKIWLRFRIQQCMFDSYLNSCWFFTIIFVIKLLFHLISVIVKNMIEFYVMHFIRCPFVRYCQRWECNDWHRIRVIDSYFIKFDMQKCVIFCCKFWKNHMYILCSDIQCLGN